MQGSRASHLAQHHGGYLLWRECLGLVEVLNLHLRVVLEVSDFEGPRFDVLLDRRIVESPPDEAPVVLLDVHSRQWLHCNPILFTYLTSKTVLAGFIAA